MHNCTKNIFKSYCKSAFNANGERQGQRREGGVVVIRISNVALPWLCSSDSTASVAVKVLILQCSHFKVTAVPNTSN